MTDASPTPAFTPAMGRFGAGRLYDVIIAAATRERLWRGLAARHLELAPGDVVVDVGCGSGSQLLVLQALQPRARYIGIDPDPRMLALARGKARQAGAAIEFREGMGDALAQVLPDARPNRIVSSLVLHQCPMAVKRSILASMHALLAPGGRLVIADYGQQRGWLMRSAFKIVQIADGFADTQPNADGVLPKLIADTGFKDVREAAAIRAVTGSISVYVAAKA